jgi:RecA/RadA recombinase
MSDTDDVSKALTTTHTKRRETIPDKDLLKTGSTVLDLGITGRRAGGFAKGKYFWMVGDPSSGKTFLMLTCLAEAAVNPKFADYRFIYDNGEDGALMDMERYFGPSMASRLEPPATDKDGEAVYSEEIEDFYFYLDDALTEAEKKGGKPCIYLLDSMDALDSKYSQKKFKEAKTAARKGTKARGDYGDGKAKINSTRIRRVISRLRNTGCILIILSQTRDNIDAGLFEEQQTCSGGHALKFYATVQLWSSVGSKIKRVINEKKLQIGVYCRVRIRKNRITGKERTIEFPIYYETGIDDIGGMIDFLTYWKFWPKNKDGIVNATADFDNVKKRREALIQWIEKHELREDLEDIVEDAWNEIEKRALVKRRSKYD